MKRTFPVLLACIGVTAVVIAGCSSSSPSKGPSASSRSHKPTSSSTVVAPTSSASTSSGEAAGSCPANAKYCAQFNGSSDGWPQANDAHYFAKYDPFSGGTYRVGERTQATVLEDAPVDITNISHDYSVEIDVDATPYQTMPLSTSAGIDCWAHKSNGHTAAFLFFVNPSTVEIGFWDDVSGQYHKIAAKSDKGLVKTDGSVNHLTAACVQAEHNGGVTAELGIKINGTVALVTHYDKSVHNYSWSVGPKVGVLASGKGSDVFYDNFAVRSLCHGQFC